VDLPTEAGILAREAKKEKKKSSCSEKSRQRHPQTLHQALEFSAQKW
jgi:hypothetical protein